MAMQQEPWSLAEANAPFLFSPMDVEIKTRASIADRSVSRLDLTPARSQGFYDAKRGPGWCWCGPDLHLASKQI